MADVMLPSDEVAAARKRKAKRRLILIIVAVALAAGAYWYFEKVFSLPLRELESISNSVKSSMTEVQQNFPGPLVAVTKQAPKKTNALTIAGVISETNKQRAANGDLPPLTENATLDDVATLRLDDLFAQQYFAHVGPQGESAITVASSVGYGSIALGENLALGVYAGDEGVVTAWMNSAGHRANILDVHYTQIGVAVRQGAFNGQQTWIAVQIFGRPSSDCPAPEANMKTSIDLSENQLSVMSAELASEKAAIDATDPPSGPQYNQKVQDYNTLVSQYNNLAAQTKTAIDQYNASVNSYNACLAK